MNAYRIPNHDASLLAGAEDGQKLKDAADRIADDWDQMTEVYTDTASWLAESGDIEDVLRALDRAAYMLGRLRDGEVTAADSTVSALLRELARQAELVSRRADAVLDEHAEEEA